MMNIPSIKDIEKMCYVTAQSKNISFNEAFNCLTEEQQAAYDEYLTRQYKNKLNTLFGTDWIKKASPVVLYKLSVKNYKKHIYTL